MDTTVWIEKEVASYEAMKRSSEILKLAEKYANNEISKYVFCAEVEKHLLQFRSQPKR